MNHSPIKPRSYGNCKQISAGLIPIHASLKFTAKAVKRGLFTGFSRRRTLLYIQFNRLSGKKCCHSLAPLGFTAEQQRQEALNRAGKMSIQGLQLKLSAALRITEGRFEVVNRGGRYILKPPSVDFPEQITAHPQ
jgi:hypothetical protein